MHLRRATLLVSYVHYFSTIALKGADHLQFLLSSQGLIMPVSSAPMEINGNHRCSHFLGQALRIHNQLIVNGGCVTVACSCPEGWEAPHHREPMQWMVRGKHIALRSSSLSFSPPYWWLGTDVLELLPAFSSPLPPADLIGSPNRNAFLGESQKGGLIVCALFWDTLLWGFSISEPVYKEHQRNQNSSRKTVIWS